MAIVHLETPDVKLVIVGDGVERARLEELAERLNLKGSIQLGSVPQESIPRLMHQADVFALSSLSESFGPIVILEAMAAGLPIVATNVGGIPDIVEEGVNGYLVNAKNPDELADRILVLLQNDEMREEMSPITERRRSCICGIRSLVQWRGYILNVLVTKPPEKTDPKSHL